MKKIFLLAITFMVIGLVVVSSQDMGNLPGMQELAAEYQAGKITLEEYQRRAEEIIMGADAAIPEQQLRDQEYDRQQQALQQQTQVQPVQQQQNNFPNGTTQGWPTAQLKDLGLANLEQPSGTQSSYTSDEPPTIYVTGANTNTLQDIKRQIETITGRQMEGSRNSFFMIGISTWGGSSGPPVQVSIMLEGSTVTIHFRITAG